MRVRLTKGKLVAGAGVAAAAIVFGPVITEQQHEADMAFRDQLVTDMHNVMIGKLALDLPKYETTTYGLFLDAGSPADAMDDLLQNMGYEKTDDATAQVQSLAACAVNAYSAEIPPAAVTHYNMSDFVGAENDCLADLVVRIDQGLGEIEAPEGLASPASSSNTP